MSSIPAILATAEQAWPEKTALIGADGAVLSYRQLGARARQLSTELDRRWGVGSDDVVALLAPNCPEFVVSYFAVVHRGAIVQPVDERSKSDEILFALLDSGARSVIVHRALWEKFVSIRDALPGVENILAINVIGSEVDQFADWMRCHATNGTREPKAYSGNQVAELLYTSGTTGEAKGVMRTHANALAASGNSIRAFGYRADDLIAIVMPLSHSSALVSQMLPMFEVGGTALLIDKFDAPGLLDSIRHHGLTCFRAVPAMFRMLLACPDFNGQQLPSLRLLMNSSAAIDASTYLEVRERFRRAQIVNSYGLTEASTCTILSDAAAIEHPGSIGAPIDGVEMRVVDSDGGTVEDEEEGEFWIRGANVFRRYHNRPDETREAFGPGGWLRTGDYGFRNSTGLFFFRGRKDEIINCGGRKFAPLDVENCILELPEIAEITVIGVTHRILGEVPKAFVVFRQGAAQDPKAVIRHCTRRLPSHKVPFFVEAVEDLPRNRAGKVLRRELRAEAVVH
jgi:long-chain acyl-CoA synthetase